jgi:large subunit ribosomal protein L3
MLVNMENIKGLKMNMSQFFKDDGTVVAVTIIKADAEVPSDLENKEVFVEGKSKGKGFAGVMKKWNFAGIGQATRGQSTKPRAPGSIGGQTPGRVYKGKKMAGRMGNQRVTIKGLKVVKVLENNQFMVSGPIPGARNSKVIVKVK